MTQIYRGDRNNSAFDTSSDLRVKKDIVSLTNCL